MRPWLSLFFLAPALLAQMQETPFAPDGIRRQQMHMLLLQSSPNQDQYFGRPQKQSQRQPTFWQYQAPPPQAPQGDPNYWHFQAPPAPERVQVQPAPKVPVGNPRPKPLVVRPKDLHFYAKPKVCSIPLINALKGKQLIPDKIAIQPPPGHFDTEVIAPPAPPCDDWK